MDSKHREPEARLIRDILLTGQKTLEMVGGEPPPNDLTLYWGVQNSSTPLSGRAFHYINNPTGTVRWFFPVESRYPAYLALFNSASWKAKLYKLGSFAAFGVGLQKHLCSGSFWIEGNGALPLEEVLQAIPHDTYGVFTGTVGENRKSIVALAQNNRVTHFAKIAHSLQGEALLRNESASLQQMAELDCQVLQVPKISPSHSSNFLLLSNVKPKQARETARIEERHIDALNEWYGKMWEKKRLGELPMFEEIQDRLEQIEEAGIADPSLDGKQVRRILRKLQQLQAEANPNEMLPLALAHGDFTPWNMYVSDQHLHVYDWELARPDMPLLYDLFHYIYQSGILLLRQPFSRIEREVSRALRLPATQKLIQRFSLDTDSLHKQYLLYLVSYYLLIYVREPQVHMQVHWLLDTWDQALTKITQ